MPVIPQVRVNPNILGGIIVRIGDRVMDGSIRRRLGILRGQMLAKAIR
jgi:F-type H+-transporting ATPase subunit delta